MSEKRPDGSHRQSVTGRRGDGSPSRLDSTRTRRAFLASGAAVSAAALVGCLGGGGSGGTPTGSEPEKPWTTEALAEYIDDDATVTIYAGTGDPQQWHDLVSVINDEFGTNVESDVFASDARRVSQRFLQERQADNDEADLVTKANDIRDRIVTEGTDVAQRFYEWGIDENFWFTDVLPSERQLPFMLGAYNGGAGLCLPLNETYFEEHGLDYPTTYNDLFDDQYEGLTAVLPGYIVSTEVGWIIEHHAAERDMSNTEWIEALGDHLSFSGASSHTAGARRVAQGDAPLMFYNFPWVVSPFVGDQPLKGHFVDPVKSDAMAGEMSINANAPHPWVARYILSAMVEESVQRRMIHDVVDQVPVRLDLDYGPQDPSPYTEKRLNAELTTIGFYEDVEYGQVGQTAKDQGAFDV